MLAPLAEDLAGAIVGVGQDARDLGVDFPRGLFSVQSALWPHRQLEELRALVAIVVDGAEPHLTDQHDPTAAVDPRKLQLFRRFKDPAILTPHFYLLFLRFAYLLALTETSDVSGADEAHKELVAFISSLKMGQFYHVRVSELLAASGPWLLSTNNPDEQYRREERAREQQYRTKLLTNRDKAIGLIIEMLRYQDWPVASSMVRQNAAR